ncbi:hypothetical protein [Polluticoccus soli]|uniref:hypothetical protein n=1 Tax=Polluticoccus soli TaxID=3034150 RepID=UPI0023E1B987|nr:hypothetical protein [Flavipsychrobacter sp. JY13-12]
MNLFSSILTAQGYPFTKAQAQLRSLQKMQVPEFIEWQQKQAWQVARFHYQNNDFYKAKVGSIFPDRWEDLPVITKKDLQQPLDSLVTDGLSLNKCHVSSTSGSTGIPFFFAKDKFAHAMTWAVIADRYRWHGLDFQSLQARFYGIPKEAKGYWREKLKDSIMRRQRFSVFDLSDETLSEFLIRFEKEQFRYIYGYTSALVLFARFLIAKNMVLKMVCPSLKVCISTSEVCTPEDHNILQQAFGVNHYREYGVSETCLSAFESAQKTFTLTEETLLTEVVSDDGRGISLEEEGNILMTSLFNRALPMVRYQVGDTGAVTESRVGIYRNLLSLTGRTNDVVTLPSGKKAAGLTFYYISRSILENSGVLKEFIIRQVAPDHFVFDIVADRDLTNLEVQTVRDKLAMYLMQGLKLEINRVDRIVRPTSGKLKHFYSEIRKG